MSRKYRAEQQKARARMRDWRRGQRYRARVRVYGAVFAGVGLLTFLWVLVGQLQ